MPIYGDGVLIRHGTSLRFRENGYIFRLKKFALS